VDRDAEAAAGRTNPAAKKLRRDELDIFNLQDY
jgi:hypothetical protein